MRNSMAILLVALLALFLVGQAQATDWTAYGLAGQGQADVWLTKTYDRVQVGPAFSWFDNDNTPEGDGYAAGLVVTYDLIKDAHLVVGDVTIPTQYFLGGKAQLVYWRATEDIDPAPSLVTGFRFGTKQAGATIVYEYALTDELWTVLAPREDEHVLLFSVYWRI